MPYMGIVWILAVVIFMILEACTYQMLSIWFVIGSVGGMAAYLFGAGFYTQMAVFVAVSVLLLVCFRPMSIKLLKKQNFKSNADSLIGKDVLITEDVNNMECTGKGKIGGMEWTVRSSSGKEIKSGTAARITKIEGVKLLVE